MSLRIEKINSLLQNYVSDIINKTLSLKPGVFISISKVDTSKDLRYTRIFVSIFPPKEVAYALATLRKEAYHVQGKLSKRMQTKFLPRIEFVNDSGQERASKVEEVFKQIEREEDK